MIDWFRRRVALWQMRRWIATNAMRYTPETEAIAIARHRLERMVAERRDSPEIVQYRAKRAAALKGQAAS